MAKLWDSASREKKWTLGALQKTGELTDQSVQGFNPYVQTGTNALSALSGSYGLGGQAGIDAAENAFRESPGYDFRMSEGINAIDRSGAARGNLMSGGTLKALNRYGQGIADQEYGNWQRGLAGLSSGGMAALRNQAQLREGQAGRIFNGYTGIGKAQAAQQTGYIGLGAQLAGSALSALAGGMGGAPGGGNLMSLMSAPGGKGIF